MTTPPLFVFDFDGVIIDGMPEYWFSSRNACIALMNGRWNPHFLPGNPPEEFVWLRPWVQHGWEMVLLAAELIREDSHLLTFGAQSFAASYEEQCNAALDAWGWTPKQLQLALEESRRKAISHNKEHWISLHNPYPWVKKRLTSFAAEGAEWAVLTTKGRDFAAELLASLDLHPNLIFGHESGGKTDVLRRIISDRSISAFVEDRRETLEKILATVDLSSIPCYLVTWGYLRPDCDTQSLPQGIRLLSPETMASPLATWS